MWIDTVPPDRPDIGDVWINMGTLRTWRSGGWDPTWDNPPAQKRKKPRRNRIVLPPEFGPQEE